jgi:hypothetical protein
METNPYQASELAEPAPTAGGCRGAILALAAIACWLLSAVWVAVGALAAINPGGARARMESPYMFMVIMVCGFLFPVVGMVLFGFASWRRSVRLAVCGLAMFLAPAALISVRLYFGPFGPVGQNRRLLSRLEADAAELGKSPKNRNI